MLGKGKTSSEAPPEEGMLGRVLGKRNVQNLPPGSSVLLDDHIYILSSQARTLKENSTSLEKIQLSGWHPAQSALVLALFLPVAHAGCSQEASL